MGKTLSVRRAIIVRSFCALLLLCAVLVATELLWPFGYTDLIAKEARRNSVEPALVAAVIFAESRYCQRAVSPKGAIGLMQIMPETGAWIARRLDEPLTATDDLFAAEKNIRLGTWYLRYLLDRFGDVEIALLAYNAGESTVRHWQQEHMEPYPETSVFAQRVLAVRRIYRVYLRVPLLGRTITVIPLLGLQCLLQ
jgi:soluble lytic murein transglycosylase